MSNSIAAIYQAHQDAVALRTGGNPAGGESAEWPTIAAALATILEERLGELPLAYPLRNAWPYPIPVPNGDWPNLLIVHERSVPRDIDSCWTEWTHSAQLVLLCGPWPGDVGTMQAMGTPYIWPIKAVLDANKSLDGTVRNVQVTTGGEEWRVLTYTDTALTARRWYGLTVPVEAIGYNLRVWQG